MVWAVLTPPPRPPPSMSRPRLAGALPDHCAPRPSALHRLRLPVRGPRAPGGHRQRLRVPAVALQPAPQLPQPRVLPRQAHLQRGERGGPGGPCRSWKRGTGRGRGGTGGRGRLPVAQAGLAGRGRSCCSLRPRCSPSIPTRRTSSASPTCGPSTTTTRRSSRQPSRPS